MTPSELQKQLTILLVELLEDTGFQKVRTGTLRRLAGECEQIFSISFTRDRGLPGNLYTLTSTLSFKYKNVDQLTSHFMGIEYDKKWSTASNPFYKLIPDRQTVSRKYCSNDELKDFAMEFARDFRAYALPFYDRFDTLNKLEKHFDIMPEYSNSPANVSVVRSHARMCCIAAVYCINQKYDKLKNFVSTTDELSDAQKKIILEYSAEQ